MNRISRITLMLYIFSIVYTIAFTIYPDILPSAITDRSLLLISNSIIFILATQFYIYYLQSEEFRSNNQKGLNRNINLSDGLSLDLKNFYEDFKNFRSDTQIILDKDALYSSLVASYHFDDKIFSDVLQRQYKIFASRLKDASQGKLILDPGNIIEIPILLAQELATSLDATSFLENDPLEGTQKDEYLQLIERKVATDSSCKVRRLFILKRNGQDDDKFMQDFQKRFEHDKNKGIDVRYIFEHEWIRSHYVNNPIDFGIWDKRRLWKFDENVSTDKYGVQFVINADIIRIFQESFNNNWAKANRN